MQIFFITNFLYKSRAYLCLPPSIPFSLKYRPLFPLASFSWEKGWQIGKLQLIDHLGLRFIGEVVRDVTWFPFTGLGQDRATQQAAWGMETVGDELNLGSRIPGGTCSWWETLNCDREWLKPQH